MSLHPKESARDRASASAPANWGNAVKYLALDAVAASTSGLLATAGVRAILLKGPATARRLYPDESNRRPYTDVDLLVPVDRFDDAQNVLHENGYHGLLTGVRDGEFAWHEIPWRAPGSGNLIIDLHRGFAGVTNPVIFFERLWTSRDQINLSGSVVWVPGAGATALVLALHAANPGRGRKPLVDIYRAKEIFAPEVWLDAARLARACGAESACRAGLDLLPDGSRFADDLGIGGTLAADAWLGGRQHNRVSVNLATALAERGGRAKMAHIVRRVLPSPAFLRLADPSARRGAAWLALAYVHRVATACVAAPRAMMDVAVARRAIQRPTRSRPPIGFVRRAAVNTDLRSLRTAAWAWQAHQGSRDQLRRNRLAEVNLSAPFAVRTTDRRAVVGLDGDAQPNTALHEIIRRAAPQEWVGLGPW